YPLELKVRAAQLDAVIKRGQEEEGAVIIRFNPGDKLIPVDAYLNGMYLQPFEIDTGANICTIPSSAVDALGIKIDESTPVRALAGVSGESTAYEVTLDSIEIRGSSVAGVKALVIDLPGMPGHGLLGLNFLNNFRVEIDKTKGLLRLSKK
ncbi:MAG: retropepsin-like aspartic protease, partial [Acidobacteriota bacterium]|nr:retropepsin-like aspartic protease [Acidobacteriota bacterium]